VTDYLKKSFSVGGYTPKAAANWDRIFGEQRRCTVCGKKYRAQPDDNCPMCNSCVKDIVIT
jgi:rRNA maturation endonuclease Nob1